MKATIEFVLPEEKDAFELCMHGNDYYRCLIEILGLLRQKIKYSDNDAQIDAAEEIKKEIIDLMDEYHITQHLFD